MFHIMTIFIYVALTTLIFQIEVSLAISSKFNVPRRFVVLQSSPFIISTDSSSQHKPIDLGLGLPDFPAPLNLRTALVNVVMSDNYIFTQYTRNFGHLRLLNALAEYYSKLLNRTLDSNDNVLVTIGATEALFITFQTHTNVGDEWIIIEPYYGPYFQMVKAAFGVPRFLALKPTKTSGEIRAEDWTFDREEMASLFNKKTKGIVINSPHNPTGKIYTLEELTFIADLARKWDTLVIFDEVYQFLIFDNKEFIRMATLPGMFERTISIGSGGKSFSATGLRLGWAYGGAEIISNLKAIHADVVMSVPTPIQEAFAITFEDELKNFGTENSYLASFKRTAEAKKNYLTNALTDLGMLPIIPGGGYFIVANWTTLSNKIQLDEEKDTYKDVEFNKWTLKNANLIGIPLSNFYSKESKHLGEDVIRYCFVKTEQTLRKGVDALSKLKSQQ